jgi:hypothetical protein
MEIPTRFLKCIMLATPEDETAVAMSSASLTDAVAVAMEQTGGQHHAFTTETFLKNGDCC